MKLKQFSQIFFLLIISLIVTPLTAKTANGRDLFWIREQGEDIQQSQFFHLNQQVTASITSVVNLPIIEHHALTETPIPPSDLSPPETDIQVETSTPTPTPIPAQTGQVNIPIVFGAFAIILVIILAWFFVGYLPAKRKN